MKTTFLLQALAAALRFGGIKTVAPLEQWHLGRQMAAFADLHHLAGSGLESRLQLKTHVIGAPVWTGTHQPERLGHRRDGSLQRVWRSNLVTVGPERIRLSAMIPLHICVR